MKKFIFRTFVELTGNRFFSYLLKMFTSSRYSRFLIKSFIKTYNINQYEMEKPIEEYHNLQELFSRRLKVGVRNVEHVPMSVGSPVDGILAESGRITTEASFFVKGQTYSLDEMLGSSDRADQYRDGTYMVFYLSPSHYHRIHSPVSGKVINQWQLGRKSYPVNKWGLLYGKRPLSRNYRLITEVKCNEKQVAIIKVGALNVNSIHSTFKDNELKIGQEIGYFSFGSTVILLFEEGMFSQEKLIKIPSEVRVGEKLGVLLGE